MKDYSVVFLLWICICSSQQAAFGPPNRPVVTISQGQLRGVAINPDPHTHAELFRGIPYAQPPVGALRLKKPEPPLPWTGVRDALNDHTVCIQNHHGNGESEDCLKLDIYRPQQTDSSSRLPVMVWIHGGGYAGGSKNINGINIVSKGVVFVSINYRLGPMGYFSTEDDTIPGNFGMLDQIQALKWIQSNIAAFGGDPASVTIFGGSAGSASCSLHILSPLSKGLFHRAIMESGVGSTSRDVPPPSLPVTLKDVAHDVGQQLGCSSNSGPDFLKCLQGKDAMTFFNASMNAAHKDHSSGPFRPRVETTFGFLPDFPLKMISRGEFAHVDTIRGFNSQEQGMAVHDRENDGLTKDEFTQLAQSQLSDYPYVDTNKYVQLMEQLYLANVTDPIEIRAKAIQMRSDFTFIGPIVRETKMARKTNHDSKSFLYNFNYRASDAHNPDWSGVLHGSEGQFVFGFNSFKHPSPSDAAVADSMMTMWTNFAKSSNPTPTVHSPLIHWDQFYGSKPSYLLIEEHLQLKTFDSPEQVAMLNLYEATVQDYLNAVDNTPVVG